MNRSEALETIREAQNEMLLWADLDAEVQSLYDSFRKAVDHIDTVLSDPGQEYVMAQVLLLAGRVSNKLQIPFEDAKSMVAEVLGEDITAGIVCGLLLETPWSC